LPEPLLAPRFLDDRLVPRLQERPLRVEDLVVLVDNFGVVAMPVMRAPESFGSAWSMIESFPRARSAPDHGVAQTRNESARIAA
jgi:hypothetical protein